MCKTCSSYQMDSQACINKEVPVYRVESTWSCSRDTTGKPIEDKKPAGKKHKSEG